MKIIAKGLTILGNITVSQ